MQRRSKKKKNTKSWSYQPPSLLSALLFPINGREKGRGRCLSYRNSKANAEQRHKARQRRGTGENQGRQVLSWSSTGHQPAIQGRTRRLCGRQWTMKQTRGRGRKRQSRSLWRQMGQRKGGEEAKYMYSMATGKGGDVLSVHAPYFLGRTGPNRAAQVQLGGPLVVHGRIAAAITAALQWATGGLF